MTPPHRGGLRRDRVRGLRRCDAQAGLPSAGTAPGGVDFQFDIYPDGHLGPTFAIEVQFGIEQPSAVRERFKSGAGARIMDLLEGWGAADERWRHAIDSAFACAVPVAMEGGGVRELGLTLMPQWAKARWVDGVLQPAKLYHLARAGILLVSGGRFS